jgi:hypothetical protein
MTFDEHDDWESQNSLFPSFCLHSERKSRHDLYIYYIHFSVLRGVGIESSISSES